MSLTKEVLILAIQKKTKLVYGVGINDADYNVYTYNEDQKVIWRCPYYVRWCSVLARCYSEVWHRKYPSYAGCSVAEVWHRFSNFKKWMENQNWKGLDLDKDLLVPGNKIYGPDTCIFIEQRVNKFLLEQENKRGNLPIGVSLSYSGKKYKAKGQLVLERKSKSLGIFNTPEEAYEAWLSFKQEQSKLLASLQTDKRVADALIKRYENYGEWSL